MKTLCTLSSVPLEKHWPVLPREEIAFSELEQDTYFPFIEKQQIPLYIHQAIEYGEKMAKECVPPTMKLSDIINQFIKKKVSIQFMEKNSANPWIRAQYIRKPPTIRIYQSSIEQLQQFFNEMNTPITKEDLMALHLLHEWFHYLEEKKYKRTDTLLPRVVTGKTMGFAHKKRIKKTREIAAHAFTQAALNLSWSPLLLDHFLLFTHKGLSKAEIREKFKELSNRFEKITEIEEIRMEDE